MSTVSRQHHEMIAASIVQVTQPLFGLAQHSQYLVVAPTTATSAASPTLVKSASSLVQVCIDSLYNWRDCAD
jgi:hypothetical protein